MRKTLLVALTLLILNQVQPQSQDSNSIIMAEIKKLEKDILLSKDPRVRKQATYELGNVAKELIRQNTILMGALMDADASVRAQAAESLSYFGSMGKIAVPTLIKMLKAEKDEETLRKMIGAAAATAPHSKAAIPFIIPHVKHKKVEIRRQAVAALGAFGSASKEAVPALVEALSDPDEGVPFKFASVSTIAMLSLQQIGPDAQAAASALEKLLKSKDFQKQGMAMGTLAKIVPKNRDLVPLFIQTLQNKGNLKLRAAAAGALSVLGPDAQDAVPFLIEALKVQDVNDQHPAAMLRYNALRALAEIGGPAKGAIPMIEKLLDDPDEGVRAEAKVVLDRLKKLE